METNRELLLQVISNIKSEAKEKGVPSSDVAYLEQLGEKLLFEVEQNLKDFVNSFELVVDLKAAVGDTIAAHQTEMSSFHAGKAPEHKYWTSFRRYIENLLKRKS